MLTEEQAVTVATALDTRGKCECAKLLYVEYEGAGQWHHQAEWDCAEVGLLQEIVACPWCLARLLPDGWYLPENWRERLLEVLVEQAQGLNVGEIDSVELVTMIGAGTRAQIWAISGDWTDITDVLPTQDEALFQLVEQSAFWQTEEASDGE